MAVDMFHCNEIARAIRLVCQGATALTADLSGGTHVSVGSNRLFSTGDGVRLRDSEGAETATVAQTIGLTTVVLDAEPAGEYLVGRGARLERLGTDLPALEWVGQGSPELMPRSPAERYPCVLVRPSVMRQPPGEGSNRTVQQDYHFDVYYVERYEEGQQANINVLERAGAIFNAIMSDSYLGGTCWHSQVIEVDAEPGEQKRLRETERPLRVVKMTVLARRAEVLTR
ncbi:MAG: hypothetical protein ACOX9R_20165 [Armatimonadota bacterium]|jgi:hypothetical protein